MLMCLRVLNKEAWRGVKMNASFSAVESAFPFEQCVASEGTMTACCAWLVDLELSGTPVHLDAGPQVGS